MRLPWAGVAAGLAAAVLGVGGLVRGAVPLSSGPSPAAVSSAPIVVTNAYVRPPAPPNDAAAAYFTVTNTTDRPDRLIAVESGAGASAVLHTAGMTAAGAAVIPAHGRLVLSTGHGHVMIQHVIGVLRPGQTVNLQLTFARAGLIEVVARVIALGAPDPTGGK